MSACFTRETGSGERILYADGIIPLHSFIVGRVIEKEHALKEYMC